MSEDRVPAVIYETRRTIHRSRSTRASGGGSQPITFAAAAAESHRSPASLGTQSP